jgi:hypothetical protein
MAQSPAEQQIAQEQANHFLGPVNGALGGLSVAEKNQDYFLLFKDITSTTPEIINQSAWNIEWLVNSNGEVANPNDNSVANSNIIQNFEIGEQVVTLVANATGINAQLLGEHTITGVGTLKNILYSQTGIPSSSFDTGSVVFIEPGGAPAESTNPVPNVLGSMIVNNNLLSAVGSGVFTLIEGYTVQTQTPSPTLTNFSGGSGKYFATGSEFIDINSITLRVSYNIDNTSTGDANINLRIRGLVGGISLTLGSDIFTVAAGTGVNRSREIPISGINANSTIYVEISNNRPITLNSLNFGVIGSSPAPTPNIPTTGFWATGSDTVITWLTGSSYVSQNYGNIQDTSAFTAATKTYGLDPIDDIFTPQAGDKIRFEYNPNNVFTIYEVITPSEASDGLLKFKLNRQVPNSTVLDNFILYRIDSNEPKSIFLNIPKNSVIGDPENPFKGYIFPKYKTQNLKDNLKSIQRQISNEGLL